ncbi:MAG: phosphatidate cytidylyltransferase [Burkholderiales bacterium]|nr:MAG: phosphatidate cytidylyltransferase [Burkholderiales bacterium]
MLGKRVVTALVLLAILLPSIFVFPAWVWGAVTLAFLAIGAHEWSLLLGHRRAAFAAAAALASGGAVLLVWHERGGWPGWFVLLAAAAATLLWVAWGPLRLRRHDARAGGWPLAAALLLACWIALVALRDIGPIALLAAMAIVWIADIAAYFVGRAVGRRKLAPTISPGKSWEGAIGGFFAVAAIGLVAASAPGLSQALPARLVEQWSPFGAVLALVALAGLSIVGDLHESLLKRQAGVKDSGTLLPGHGGVLDRIDALIPTMPAAMLLHRLLG